MKSLIVICLLITTSNSFAQEVPKLTYILCDLSLESQDEIEVLIDRTKKSISEVPPEQKVVILYFKNDSPKQLLTLPFVNTVNNGSTHMERILRNREIENDKRRKKELAETIGAKILETYSLEFKVDNKTPISCLTRFVSRSISNLVIDKYDKTHSVEFKQKEIIFISDLEINCFNSQCGGRILTSELSFKELSMKLSNCRIPFPKNEGIDFRIYSLLNSKNLPLEKLEELWSGLLIRSGISDSRLSIGY